MPAPHPDPTPAVDAAPDPTPAVDAPWRPAELRPTPAAPHSDPTPPAAAPSSRRHHGRHHHCHHRPIAPAVISSELAHGGAPYIAGLGPLHAAPPLPLRRGSPSGFPALASPTWSPIVAPSALPAADFPLVDTLATIQAAVTASRERERVASLALEREHALGAALTTQMATTQRLLGRPPTAPAEPPEDPLASDLDADLIAALHAQAEGLHNIRALVSMVLDPASPHSPRWRG